MVFLGQAKYGYDILDHAQMLEARHVSMPWYPGMQLDSKNVTPFRDLTLFRSIVSILQYLTITRHDFSFAVNSISQYL